MQVPPNSALLDRVRSLPATGPLLDRLGDAGGVYLVGGSVRDLLLGGVPQDLDLVVEGDVGALVARLGRARTYDRFGTSTVEVEGFSYDIARARSETYSRPGALPDVSPARLDQDLRRRDFTVNALAIALGGPEAGSLHAVSGGLDDLDARRLRVLHARSFVDDPTRLLRLARYASRLRFAIEPETLALARFAVDAGALHTVSGSRLGAELRLLAREPDPVTAFETLAELQIDAAIGPGLGLHDPPLARRALGLLPGDGRRDLVVLALAAQHVPREALADLIAALAFEAFDRDVIVGGAARAQALAHSLELAGTPSQIAQAVAGAGHEVVALAGALGPAEKARQWLQRLRHIKLEIGGDDLLAAGIPQGPEIGRGLNAALVAKLDGRASGHDRELAEALRAVAGSG